MNRNYYIPIIFGILVLVVIYLFLKILSVSKSYVADNGQLTTTMEQIRDSLGQTRRTIDSLEERMPGLGEYMSAIQLHVSKIWFAEQASNWELAKYELNELREAVEGAEALHVYRNSVNITAVLESVKQTQLPLLEQSLKLSEPRDFRIAYDQTLSACNGCHQAAGYKFIHIVLPKAEPVVNQDWKISE